MLYLKAPALSISGCLKENDVNKALRKKVSEHVDCRVCSAPLLVAWDSVRFYDPDGRSKHWSAGSLKQIHPKGDIIYILTKLISALWMHVTYLFTKRVTNACFRPDSLM